MTVAVEGQVRNDEELHALGDMVPMLLDVRHEVEVEPTPAEDVVL